MTPPTPTWEETITAIAEKYIPFERGTTARVRMLLKEDINKAVLELVIGEDTIKEGERWRYSPKYLAKDDLRTIQRRIVTGEIE